MKNFNYFIVLLINLSCIGNINYDHNADNKRLFKQYLLTFEKQNIPFQMNRKAVFEMMNNADSFYEIEDSLKKFIPKELITTHPESIFRSLYLLPEHGEIALVMILQDYINEYDMRVVKNYVVSYNKCGEEIDFKELAGVVIDGLEAFFEINSDYVIKRKLYQRRIIKEKKYVNYAYLAETIYEYSIDPTGRIEEIERTFREGYYEGDWSGYSFVKPLKD